MDLVKLVSLVSLYVVLVLEKKKKKKKKKTSTRAPMMDATVRIKYKL